MTPDEELTLAVKLHECWLANEVRQVTLATKEQLEELKPAANELCHSLAERWVSLHPEHRVVRGFLAVNENRYQKHSVVDTGSGLLDVTPRIGREPLLDFIALDAVSNRIFEGCNAVIQFPPCGAKIQTDPLPNPASGVL